MKNLKLKVYSEKTFVVTGEDTKKYREQLKRMGGKFNGHLKDSEGVYYAGWIFPKTKLDDLRGFISSDSDEIPRGAETASEGTKIKLFDLLKARGCNDYVAKNASGIVDMVDAGFTVMMWKECIEKDFCFGYSSFGQGGDYDEARDAAKDCRENEEYFIEQNMHKYLEFSKAMEEGDLLFFDKVTIGSGDLWGVGVYSEYRDYKKYVMYKDLTDADKKRFDDFFADECGKMRDRLDKYLRKYGLSKLHVWTYNMDD